MRREIAVFGTLSCALFAPRPSLAANCAGTIALDPNTGWAALGEINGHLAMCQRRYDGTQIYTPIPSCSAATPSGDLVRLSDAGGGDATTIGPLDHDILCGGTQPMHPWSPTFAFGLWYTGYGADDYILGTPNADVLHSFSYVPGLHDASPDQVCGYGGDDELYGDVDGPAPTVPLACLDGGAGTDDCSDGAMTPACEYTAWYTLPVGGCGCSGPAAPRFWVW
jgi:hypothetical protein